MRIILSPQRRDDHLLVVKTGNVLIVNGELFDFSQMESGDTLPRAAIASEWFASDVEYLGDELVLTLVLPNPQNYSPAQAFPVDLMRVPDGQVVFPGPLPNQNRLYDDSAQSYPAFSARSGVIDWSQLVTRAIKEAAASAAVLLAAREALAQRNADAALRITRINDRIETLSYGIEAGEASAEDEAEQAALQLILKAWKGYKFTLGKVTSQTSWPAMPDWPVEPIVPAIFAEPAP